MRIGVCAWSTNRGLGIQSWEAVRHLKPAKVMVLHAGPSEFDAVDDRFPGAMHVSVGTDHQLPEGSVRSWLEDLDVVFAAESLTDWRMVRWAEDAGVATVCQVNPEFFKHGADPTLQHPTQWWAPTSWRLASLPQGTVVVPVPVALDRFVTRESRITNDGMLKVLHVGGRRAIYDRNGTDLVARACELIQERVGVRITCQDAPPPRQPNQNWSRVPLEVVVGNTANYWDLYAGYDVLVLPRRYGGLCLPAQEAMAAGLAVVMPDCSPNWEWPILPIPVTEGAWSRARMPGGTIQIASVHARKVAEIIDCLATSPELLAEQKRRSVEWAETHSWEALEPLYRAQLEDACDRRTRP